MSNKQLQIEHKPGDGTRRGAQGRAMRTPDGREFQAEASGSPLSAAGAAAMDIVRVIGKLIATIWRLARALDSALWRGAKLIARKLWRGVGLLSRAVVSATRDLIAWIPTRAGRAYCAASGLFLLIVGLWMADEIRARPESFEGGQTAARPPVDKEDPIVARIAGRYIHLSDIRAAAIAGGQMREDETLTVEAAFSRDLVRSYVEQRLLARAAAEAGLQRSGDTARRLNAARDRILAAAYMDDRLKKAVTPEAVKRLYAAQSDVTRLGDEVRARHILVETREEAENILVVLNNGGDFEEIAKARSKDRSTAPLGGEIGYFTRDMMTPPLASAAFNTEPGQIAPIFETEFGWHVLEVLDRRATGGVPFSAVERNIERFLSLRTIEQTLAELKEAEKVTYYAPLNDDGDAPARLDSAGDSEAGSLN